MIDKFAIDSHKAAYHAYHISDIEKFSSDSKNKHNIQNYKNLFMQPLHLVMA